MMKNIGRTLFCCLSFVLSTKCFAIQATATNTVFTDTREKTANLLRAWNVNASSLHYTPNAKGMYTASFVYVLRFIKDGQTIKEERKTVATPPRATAEEARAQTLVEQTVYSLPPGNYELECIMYEEAYKNEIIDLRDDVEVPEPALGAAALSDIQLLDTSLQGLQANIFSRGNFTDIPLASNFYPESKNSLNFYFEPYIACKHDSDRYFTVQQWVSLKPYGSIVNALNKLDTIYCNALPQGIRGSLPIGDLSSGNYYLNVRAFNNQDFVLTSRHIMFQRFSNSNKEVTFGKTPEGKEAKADTASKSDGPAQVLDLTVTFVAKYTPAQVRAILKMLSLIADAREKITISGFIETPDELYSKYFIYNFWEKRDGKNPEKAWKAYAEKIVEVNKLFGSKSKPGYETDRGRIYIQYGKPNDRIIVNNELGAYPYEIWQYYSSQKQGTEGVFLFYKPARSLGGYELLHTTFPGEKRNMNWRSYLYNNNIPGSTVGSTENSRAEEYIGNR